jgi:hypothetical protein
MALGQVFYNDACAAGVYNGLTSIQWDEVVDSGMEKLTNFINQNRGSKAGLLYTPGELAYATIYRRYRSALAMHEGRPMRAYKKIAAATADDNVQY